MNKEVVFSYTLLSDESVNQVTYTFYGDNTWVSDADPKGVGLSRKSLWRIKDGKFWYRHYKGQNWNEWYVHHPYEKEEERYILKVLDMDSAIEEFLDE